MYAKHTFFHSPFKKCSNLATTVSALFKSAQQPTKFCVYSWFNFTNWGKCIYMLRFLPLIYYIELELRTDVAGVFFKQKNKKTQSIVSALFSARTIIGDVRNILSSSCKIQNHTLWRFCVKNIWKDGRTTSKSVS